MSKQLLAFCLIICLTYSQEQEQKQIFLGKKSSTGQCNTQLASGYSIKLKGDNGLLLNRCSLCAGNPAWMDNPDSANVNSDPADQGRTVIWAVIDLGGGKFAFQSDSGKYLAYCHACAYANTPLLVFVQATDTTQTLAQWTVQCIGGDVYSFKNVATGTYLSRCGGCINGASNPNGATLHATDNSQAWSRWTLIVASKPGQACTNLIKGGQQLRFKGDNGLLLTRCSGCLYGSQPYDSATINVAPTDQGAYATWTTVDLGGGKFGIKSDNGKFLAYCNQCTSGNVPLQVFISGNDATQPLAQWIFECIGGDVWALKNVQTNNYLSRCEKCNAGYIEPQQATVHMTNSAMAWSRWNVIVVSGGVAASLFNNGDKLKLKSDNGLLLTRCYDCITGAGSLDSATIHVSPSAVNAPWAIWTLVDVGSGKFALQADNGQYLSYCQGCAPGAVAEQVFVHSKDKTALYSQWFISEVSSGVIVLKNAQNNKLLSRCNGCYNQAKVTDTASVHLTDASLPYTRWTYTKV